MVQTGPWYDRPDIAVDEPLPMICDTREHVHKPDKRTDDGFQECGDSPPAGYARGCGRNGAHHRREEISDDLQHDDV